MRKLVGLLWLLSVPISSAGTLDLGAAKNEVSFLAIGRPSALKIKGVAKEGGGLSGLLKVEGKALSGTAILKLSGLDTGIAMRDKHMKEKYLEIQKYPIAELNLSQIPAEAKDAPFKAQLKLHGLRQTVTGKSSLEIAGASLTLNLEFTLLLKDFMIEIPSYLGIKVANEVKVSASSVGNLL